MRTDEPGRHSVASSLPGVARFSEDLTTAYILVADDSRTARSFICRHLRECGFGNLQEVEDGWEALQVIRARRPELIITDLIMPELDGLQLCRALQNDPQTRDIPVLAQTVSTDPDLRAKAFDCGATDLLPKPFDPRELISRVRILVERGRLIERLTDFRRRIAEELLQAAAIQETLLPTAAMLEHLKSRYPIDLSGHYQASEEIGGDIWGIEPVSERRILIYNADFAGHGLGAALNTVRLHSFIHSHPNMPASPAAFLTNLNRFFCEVLPTGQYATMFCAIMDFHSCMIEYCSAGAPPQLLRGSADLPFEIIEKPGFPLGVTGEATYESRIAPFLPGGQLLLFSDVLIESPPPPAAVFTPSSLCGFANSLPPASGAEQVRDQILGEFFARIPSRPEDDLTLIAAKFACEETLR